MLSVAMHKDIGEYEPKIIGKLTARTLVCICGAVGLSVAAGVYMYFVLGLNPGDNMLPIYAVSLPFWACGFLRPKGMKFELFALYWALHNFSDTTLCYRPSMYRIGLVRRFGDGKKKGETYERKYRKLLKRRGIECYSPREGHVLAR